MQRKHSDECKWEVPLDKLVNGLGCLHSSPNELTLDGGIYSELEGITEEYIFTEEASKTSKFEIDFSSYSIVLDGSTDSSFSSTGLAVDKEFFAKFSAGSIAPFTYWIPEKLGLYCDPCVGESVNLAILSPHEINFGQGTGDQPSTNIKTIDMSTFF